MSELEHKTCPRCHTTIECRVDAIDLCQCSAVKINDKEREFISDHFEDCLCAACMKDMKEEYFNKQVKDMLHHRQD
jgi:hypothetical protein